MPKAKIQKPIISYLKTYLIPAVVVILVVASGLGLVFPKIKEANKLRRNLKVQKSKLAKLTVKVNDLEGLDQLELAHRAEKVTEALPNEKEIPYLMVTLTELVNRHHLEMESFSVNPGELATASAMVKNKAEILDIKLAVKGQMQDFKKFLTDLFKIAPLMRTHSLQFKSGQFRGTVEINLPVKTPFLPLPLSLGKLDKPLPKITDEENLVYQQIVGLETIPSEGKLVPMPVGKANPFKF
jgi:Tfp pilus assembly protein PilO